MSGETTSRLGVHRHVGGRELTNVSDMRVFLNIPVELFRLGKIRKNRDEKSEIPLAF